MNLSAEESELVECVRDGHPMITSGVIRAWVIREILRGRLTDDLDPRGLQIYRARIEGRLDLRHMAVDVPIEFSHCTLEAGLDVSHATTPALRLIACVVGSQVANLVAFEATGLSTSSLLMAKCSITSSATDAAVRIIGASIGGTFNASGTQITSSSGSALVADRIIVGQNLFLRDGFGAEAHRAGEAVRLVGATIGGQLSARGATLSSESGVGLMLDGARIGGDVVLAASFSCANRSESSSVRMLGCRVGGQVNFSGASLTNDSGPALGADRLIVDGGVYLHDGFQASGIGHDAVVRLPGVQVAGGLYLDPDSVTNFSDSSAAWEFDGLTAGYLPRRPSVGEWLRTLREATPTYSAQPYRHLADHARASGHDGELRRVLVAQRHDQLKRGTFGGGLERRWVQFTGLTLGYGYQPWRALLILLASAAVAIAVALIASANGALVRDASEDRSSVQCSTVEAIGVGLGIGLPLVDPDTETCTPASGVGGETVVVIGWVLQLVSWAAASLFVVGFTSVVRKP